MASQDDWSVDLTVDERNDIVQATEHAFAAGRTVETIAREDFALPSLRTKIDSWVETLGRGRGFVLVPGFSIDRFTPKRKFLTVGMLRRLVGVGVGVVVALAGAAPALATAGPGTRDRVVVRARLTLDGAPFDAQFLGAEVVRDGLVTPCHKMLPAIRGGRATIAVLARTEAVGCGSTGSRIVLWTFVDKQFVYSGKAVPWPGNGRTIGVDAAFEHASPTGAAPPTFGIAGELFGNHGRRLPPGTKVEAFIGGTRCGVASTRTSGNFSGYSLAVVGPESIPACALGATITFRANGRLAAETAVNERGHDLPSFDLSVP